MLRSEVLHLLSIVTIVESLASGASFRETGDSAATMGLLLSDLFLYDHLEVCFHLFLCEEVFVFAWQVSVLESLLQYWVFALVRLSGLRVDLIMQKGKEIGVNG